jgi:aspartate aminotransferase
MGTLGMCNRILGFINAPAFMQRVIGRSLESEIDIGHYVRKRDRLCRALEEAGYEFPVPEGGFYVFVRSPEPEEIFIERAKRHLLLAVPGRGFGMQGFFRLCYAVPDPVIDLACRLLIEIKRESK